MSSPADIIREALADLPAHGLQAEALAALTELEQQLEATYSRGYKQGIQLLVAAEADRDREKEIVAKLDLEHAALVADRDRWKKHAETGDGMLDQAGRALVTAEADRDRLQKLADDRLALIRSGEQGWNEECEALKADRDRLQDELDAIKVPDGLWDTTARWHDEATRYREALERIIGQIEENHPETHYSDNLAPYPTQSLAFARQVARAALDRHTKDTG